MIFYLFVFTFSTYLRIIIHKGVSNMKKSFLLTVFILTSCVNNQPLSFRCGQLDDTSMTDYNIYLGDYLCVSETVINRGRSLNYSEDDFSDFYGYSIKNKKTYKTRNQDSLFGGTYYADKYGNKIPTDATIHVFGTNAFDDYVQHKKTQKLKQQMQNEENKEIARLEKKYNLKFCSSHNDVNCLIRIPLGRYVFMQHIDEGTLIVPSSSYGAIVGPNYYQGASIYLIVGNTDSYLQDGNFVEEGEFKVLGVYSYKTIRGVEKRAVKIRRL